MASATRPADLRLLLDLANGCRRVVELGTATGWTAITLALDDPQRQVTTYDVLPRHGDRFEPSQYLRLVSPAVRARIDLVVAPGASGPRGREPVDLLYIDSSHQRQDTINEVRAWQPHLGSGAVVLFDDYTNPAFPGVRQAIDELRLEGELHGRLFVHRHLGA